MIYTRVTIAVLTLFWMSGTSFAFRVYDATKINCSPQPACAETDPIETVEVCKLAKPNITYWIDRDSIPRNLSLDDVRKAVREAAAPWEKVNGLATPVTFTEALSAPAPLLNPNDNVVVITWDKTGSVSNGEWGQSPFANTEQHARASAWQGYCAQM